MTDLFNLEAEKAVLGSILLDNSVLPIVAGILSDNDFYSTDNADIYEIMMKKEGPIDLLTMKGCGSSYLAELTSSVPSLSGVEHYARIVRRLAVTRRLNDSLAYSSRDLTEGKTVEDVLVDLSPFLTAAASLGVKREPVNAVKDAFEHLEAIQCGEVQGYLPLGLSNLDPFAPSLGEMTTIAAWPSVGKTALAIAIAENVSSMNTPTLFISAEMRSYAVYWRRLASLSGIDQTRFRHEGGLKEGDWNKVVSLCQTMQTKARPFHIVDDVTDAAEIEATIRRYHIQYGIKTVFIDHLHILNLLRGETEERRLANTTKRFSHITKEIGLSTFLLCQLVKPHQSRGENPRPRNSDLKWSQAIEDNTDIMYLLHREQRFSGETNQILECQVTKNRNGPVGLAELEMSMPSGSITDSMGQRDYPTTHAAASHPRD